MSLENEFLAYHRKNPQVYELVKRFAKEAMSAGHLKLSISLIWERIRWEVVVQTGDLNFKMPNNHRAYYSRMWLRDHPNQPGFFRVARLRSKESFPRDRYGREEASR